MRLAVWTIGLFASLLLGTTPVAAQTEATAAADSPAVRAIAEGKEGVALFEEQKWPAALEHFRRAEALFHSPVFVLYAARSLRRLGRLREARALLEGLARESLDATAPVPWQNARAAAELELTELRAAVPSVNIRLEGGSAAASLSIDGEPAKSGQPLELDPGPHRAAAHDGARQRELDFTLVPGSHSELVLSLAVERPTPIPTKPLPAKREPYWTAWTLTGAGALALASGGVVGVVALVKTSQARDSLSPEVCEDQRCLSAHRAAVEDHFAASQRLALASDILWISGSVLAATGLTLLIVDPRSPAHQSARLQLRPNGAALDVRF